MSSATILRERVARRDVQVGIIGMGYVGLPLALLFADAGVRVLGFDVDVAKVEALNDGRSYIHRILSDEIAAAKQSGLRATTEIAELSACDAVLICVPTPLAEDGTPDTSFITSTVEALAPHVRAGQLIVLESTTWPGTTTELVVPALEAAGVVVQRDDAAGDVMVAFSPEREDPGNTEVPRRAVPKVVGGVSREATEVAAALYETIFDRAVMVSSTEAAEMTKLLENGAGDWWALHSGGPVLFELARAAVWTADTVH